MTTVYLSLGSNFGNRENYLAEARLALMQAFTGVRFSGVYETEPVEYREQPWFLNQVAEVQTEMDPETLLEWARQLESRQGRQRTIPKGPRSLDVDLLLYGDLVLLGKELVLPHPAIRFRRHVLVPLAELAGGKLLPDARLTVGEALQNTQDFSKVNPYASS